MDKKEKDSQNKIPGRLILSILMVLIYICMAVVLVVTPLFDHFDNKIRYGMAAVFLIYGILRSYRLWRNI